MCVSVCACVSVCICTYLCACIYYVCIYGQTLITYVDKNSLHKLSHSYLTHTSVTKYRYTTNKPMLASYIMHYYAKKFFTKILPLNHIISIEIQSTLWVTVNDVKQQ